MARRKSRFRNRTETARVERLPRAPVATAEPANLADQYRYVFLDLRRVGITAAVLVLAMVLLRIFVIK